MAEKPRDLEDRTFEFAQAVRGFVKQLPRTLANIEDVLAADAEARRLARTEVMRRPQRRGTRRN